MDKLELSFRRVKSEEQIAEFLSKLEAGSNSFRYFQSRPLSTFNEHILTYLLYNQTEPMAYGHLDKENEVVWLGIAVADEFTGRGIGEKMLQKLINGARNHKIESVALTVDADNFRAISLYEKFGFNSKVAVNDKTIKYELTLW